MNTELDNGVFKPRERHQDDYADADLVKDFPIDFKQSLVAELPSGVTSEAATEVVKAAKQSWSPTIKPAEIAEKAPDVDIAETLDVDESTVDALPDDALETKQDELEHAASQKAAVVSAQSQAVKKQSHDEASADAEKARQLAAEKAEQQRQAQQRQANQPSGGDSIASGITALGNVTGSLIGGVVGGAAGGASGLYKSMLKSASKSASVSSAAMTAIMPKISDYRVGQVAAKARQYENAQARLMDVPAIASLHERINQRAIENGVSSKAIIQDMRPDRLHADLHADYVKAVKQSPDALAAHDQMNKALTGFMKQREKAGREIGAGVPDQNEQSMQLNEKLKESDEAMLKAAALTPAIENEHESHMERLTAFFNKIMDFLKGVAAKLTNRNSHEEGATLGM